MKHTTKRLLALLLALSMALSLLSVSVWAAEEPDGSVSVVESQEEALEAEPEESEAEPEPEESEPEFASGESEAEPDESAPEERTPAPAEAEEAEPDAEEPPEEEGDKESITVQDDHTHTHKNKNGNIIVNFEAWGENDSLPCGFGSYYLTTDVVLTDTWVPENVTINLCLNGHTITMNGDGAVISVGSGATLNLYDGESNADQITHAEGKTGHGVYVKGTFNLYGGTITGNGSSGYGGGVYVAGGSFTMNGGSITENEAAIDGGGVYVVADGSFDMNGGSITENKAQNGGGVYVAGSDNTVGSSFTMNGGSIEENSAARDGGGVFVAFGDSTVDGYGSFTMDGGSITGNKASSGSGGGVLNHGDFRMKKGSISGNIATFGGGVANRFSFSTIGGSIEENHAFAGGGVLNYGDLTIGFMAIGLYQTGADTVIRGNQAKFGGGVLLDAIGGGFEFTAGSIVGNTADYGGGVLLCDLKTIGQALFPELLATLALPSGSESSASLMLWDSPFINGNKNTANQKDNVCIMHTKELQPAGNEPNLFLTICGSLENTTPIGVNMVEVGVMQTMDAGTEQNPPVKRIGGVFTEDLPGEGAGAYGDASNFVSDDEDHIVTLTEEGEAQLVEIIDVTVTADDKTSVFNEALKELTYTVKGAELSDADKASLKITASTSAKKGSDAGEYDIELTPGEGANPLYRVTLEKGKYTITKARQAAPDAPKVKESTDTSITVETVSGQEYSIDGGKTWQSAGSFTGLNPNQSYKIMTRIPGDKNHEPSEASSETVAQTREAVKPEPEPEPQPQPKPKKKTNPHLRATITQTGDSLTVSWTRRSDVDTFEIHVDYCGKHFGDIPTVTVKTKRSKKNSYTITKLGGKALKTNKNFRVQVVGKKKGKVICKSEICHIVGSKNRKRTNAKDITNLPAKTVTLKLNNNKKKTRKLKPKTVKQFPKRKQLGKNHTSTFRYVSSDESVATVNEKGKVTAVGKGKCSVYVIARNGLEKEVKVRVETIP